MHQGLRLVVWVWLALAACFVLGGCERKAQAPAAASKDTTGYLSGLAMLSDQPEGGHAGIQIYLGGTSFSARTDENGRYLIGGIPKGTYSVMAEKSAYASAAIGKAEVIPGVHTAEKPLVMDTEILERTTTGTATGGKEFGSLAGQVLLNGATTNEGVRVRLDGTQIVTVTDEIGVYRFLNVDPGHYVVSFSHPRYRSATAVTTVEAGREALVDDVVLQPTGQAPVAVAATPSPTPLEEIQVSALSGDRTIQGGVELLDAEGNPITDYTRATVSIDNSDYVVTPNAQGRFRFENLKPGMYTVLAVLDGGTPSSQTVDVTQLEVADIKFRLGGPSADAQTTGTATIIGRVVLPDAQGEPQPDAGGVRVSIIGTQSVASSARNGTFRIENVPVGTYSIEAAMEDYEAARQDGVVLESGAVMDVGDLILEPKRDYPRVVSTTPKNGATNVEVSHDLIVQVKFSKKMNTDAVKSSVLIEPAANTQYFMGRGEHELADDDNLVIVFSNQDERSPIRFNENYRFTIVRTAADTDGTEMREDYRFSFRTGNPGVISTYPANGSTNQMVDQLQNQVRISFNTKIKTERLDDSDFRISPRTDQDLQISSFEDPRTGWTTLMLRTRFVEDTNYSITVGRSVRAFNGAPLGNTPYTFRFRTFKLVPLDSRPNEMR